MAFSISETIRDALVATRPRLEDAKARSRGTAAFAASRNIGAHAMSHARAKRTSVVLAIHSGDDLVISIDHESAGLVRLKDDSPRIRRVGLEPALPRVPPRRAEGGASAWET